MNETKIEFDLVDLGHVTGTRFDEAKGYYNQMFLDRENNRFIKLTKIDFDEALAKKLLRELVYYHKFLSDVGIRVPKNFYLGINEGTHILEIDEYIPDTFSTTVKNLGVEQTVKLLFEDVFYPLFNSSNSKYLECGLDTPLRNFQFKDNHAYYIDFFLPRVFFGIEETVIEIPDFTLPKDRRIGFFNKFEAKGVLYSTFINLCREFPSHRKFFQEICIDLSYKVKNPSLAKYIHNNQIADLFTRSSDDRKNFIKKLSFEDEEYFLARDFACYLAMQNESFAPYLEDFFKATSNGGGNPFYVGDRIEKAKEILLKNL